MTTTTAPANDPALRPMDELLDALEPVESQEAAVERIRDIERLMGRFESVQLNAIARLEAYRVAQEAHDNIPTAQRGKGLGAEVALARSVSPARGKQHLELAGKLFKDMRHTGQALADGRIRAEHARAVAKETSELSSEHRSQVDAAMQDRLGMAGPRALAQEARAHAQRLDPHTAAKRFAKAQDSRRVTTQPADDGMSKLIAIGPTPQIVAAEKSLRQWANTQSASGATKDKHGKKRTRDQLMFDELIRRLTGESHNAKVVVEILLAMTPTTLLAHGDEPAWLVGHGPIPAPIARQWLLDEDLTVQLRRVFTDPAAHELTGLESRTRAFPAGVRKMVLLRDNVCRTPYCEAPIIDVDHMTPYRDGGPTNWQNASGLCAACNQTKENRGWRHEGNATTLQVVTPTGHRYTNIPGPIIPGAMHEPQREPEPPDGHRPDHPEIPGGAARGPAP